MNSSVAETEVLQAKWQRAMAALSRAQAAFTAIELTAEATDAVYRRAWMGLWRAERYHIALTRREHHV
ncbi:MAG: hypothetical protein WDM77_21635 [Steroidobacteraceae bacterium]